MVLCCIDVRGERRFGRRPPPVWMLPWALAGQPVGQHGYDAEEHGRNHDEHDNDVDPRAFLVGLFAGPIDGVEWFHGASSLVRGHQLDSPEESVSIRNINKYLIYNTIDYYICQQ